MNRSIDVDPAFRVIQDAAFKAALEANVAHIVAHPELQQNSAIPPYLRQLAREQGEGKPLTQGRADELSRIGTS